MKPALGVIADDLTGATDIANTLVRRGMAAIQTIGVPKPDIDIGEAAAVVVALKTRTCPASDAVAQSVEAARKLESLGAQQIVFKYCSTFDSTQTGNIGPVADALLEETGSKFALVCPASPENGRTIYKGHLFVGDRLLSESPMRQHPLTPMTDSNLIRLLDTQSKYSSGLIDIATVRAGPDEIRRACRQLHESGCRFCIADAIEERDLEMIGAAAAGHQLVTGASGVAIGLPANFRNDSTGDRRAAHRLPDVPGRSLVLAGSCSTATRAQIANASAKWPSRKLAIDGLAAGTTEVADAVAWAAAQPAATPVVIYGSSDPDEVAANQRRYGIAGAGDLIESGLSAVAGQLVARGFTRLVVAGGETSGAVVNELEIRMLRIGSEIEPGVPWTESIGDPCVALALKSGNFGGPDFFARAFEVLR